MESRGLVDPPPRTLFICTLADMEKAPGWREHCEALLADDERTRLSRFALAEARDTYLLAHALKRWVLSLYLNLRPRDIGFNRVGKGRPELVSTEGSGLSFNLSHAHQAVVLAVSRDSVVGVDIECLSRRLSDPLALAASHFSPSEYQDLSTVDPGLLRQRFFAYWTLKEAYIKARGLGIAGNLRASDFHLPPEFTTVDASVRPRLRNEGADVADFHLLTFDADYLVASAWLRGAQGMPPQPFRCVPGGLPEAFAGQFLFV